MDGTTSPNALVEPTCLDDLQTCGHCLFCGSDHAAPGVSDVADEFFRADPGRFDFLRCGDCGSIWLSQRPVGPRLLKAYSNYYTHTGDVGADANIAGLRGLVRAAYFRSRFENGAGLVDWLVAKGIALSGYNTAGLDRGMRFIPAPPAKVLDYGCGSGKFLLRLQKLDYELHGVEYDPHLLQALADVGIAIHDVATLTDDRWNREFDHITLSHVLEHVPDPRALLRRLFGWLKPGGGLYLELPNAGATGLDIFGRYWRGLEAPRHFSLPTPRALIAALEAEGFVVERQHVECAARAWVWNVSLGAAPPDQRAALQQAMASAPAETVTNAEFLTFLARRPA